jgi:2-keto-3-deoxy-L-fuconate dehydrogenase
MARLAGKTAFVTAAAQGIGRATALAFAREGARVVATDVNEAKLKDLAAIQGIRTAKLDVLDAEAVRRMAKELGVLDVLFNCAGWVANGSILEATEADWDRSFALNARSMFVTIKAFLPAMLGAGKGSIVNIASVASSMKGLANRCAYGASKAAVIGLTKAVAADVIGKGVRCNAIAPGTVQSPSLDERIAAYDDPVAARKAFIARQPMGRLGEPEEIAHMAVYLASDESVFMTGQVVAVDGGVTL